MPDARFFQTLPPRSVAQIADHVGGRVERGGERMIGSALAEMPRLPGLYLINGFGARGIVWSALAGELLACLITAAPLPLPDDLVNAVDPGRFLLRGRSRRQRTDSQPSRPGAR